MRMSQLVGNRYKEQPVEATLASHAFLLRGGYVRQVANGIYSMLPPAMRIARKIEAILRDEMNRLGGQEVLMPVVLPRDLWDESGRYQSVGLELVRFNDRTGHGMLLGMTHEEAAVALARNEISSYSQLPLVIYQIQTKFRDEPRSRGGLIRVREFTMKDAYSFHVSLEDLHQFYMRCCETYKHIFFRVGLPQVEMVESDTGMMGGLRAHAFMLLTDVGEDTVAVCDTCSYRANMEVATGRVEPFPEDARPLEKVHTPGKKTIEEVTEFLAVPPRKTAKVVFYDSDHSGRLVVALIRGDLEANDWKVARLIRKWPVPADEARIVAAGAVPGYASPMGLDPEKIRVLVDETIAESGNLVCGANEPDYHFINFNLARDMPGIETVDIRRVPDGARCPLCAGTLNLRRGIEVGNTFQLGVKYTTAMGMAFTDAQGKSHHPVMGSYGIGVGRLISSIIEAHHDQYGPKWPMSVAPWQVHINALKLDNPDVRDHAERLYQQLAAANVDVLYDDRNASPGVQFADADLLGIPIRLIVSPRNVAAGQIEYKRRSTGETGLVPLEGTVGSVINWIGQELESLNADMGI
ncbi:MAG TPA: proline--tRNA ligase [Candidatus Bathyarchaeia archaeon]|nr:proline--tRNA ligase [Candidatus Bathyarchaeia archaeon]